MTVDHGAQTILALTEAANMQGLITVSMTAVRM